MDASQMDDVIPGRNGCSPYLVGGLEGLYQTETFAAVDIGHKIYKNIYH